MNIILKALIPVAFVISLGWIVGWRKIIDNKCSKHLANYVINISFPCLLLMKTATSKAENLINYRSMFGFALGLMGMYLFMYVFNRYIYKRSVRQSCQSSFMCSFPNMAFMGIPIFMVLFGEQSLIAIVVGNIITSIVMIPVTISILECADGANVNQIKTDILSIIIKVFRKPLVLAPIFGFMLSLLNIKLPDLAIDSLKLIGTTTSGVSLFALGLMLSADKIRLNKYVLSNIFFKNCIHPSLMYFIVFLLNITGYWAQEIILLCAMPSAITATMFSAKYDVLKEECNSSAIIGTLFSLFTLAIFINLLGVVK